MMTPAVWFSKNLSAIFFEWRSLFWDWWVWFCLGGDIFPLLSRDVFFISYYFKGNGISSGVHQPGFILPVEHLERQIMADWHPNNRFVACGIFLPQKKRVGSDCKNEQKKVTAIRISNEMGLRYDLGVKHPFLNIPLKKSHNWWRDGWGWLVGLVISFFFGCSQRIDQLSEENRGLKVLLQDPGPWLVVFLWGEGKPPLKLTVTVCPWKIGWTWKKEIPALESIILPHWSLRVRPPNGKGSSSNQHVSGAMLNFGAVFFDLFVFSWNFGSLYVDYIAFYLYVM